MSGFDLHERLVADGVSIPTIFKSFVHGLAVTGREDAVVAAIVTLSHALGLVVIAEELQILVSGRGESSVSQRAVPGQVCAGRRAIRP